MVELYGMIGFLASDAWLQLETNCVAIFSAMISVLSELLYLSIDSLLSSGRQAALAMHEAYYALMIW